MNIAITTISSKGQIVIPSSMRKNLEEGDKLIVFQDNDRIIMKNAKDIHKNFWEDIEFAKKTEEAFLRINKGKGTKMEFDDFIEEMKKW